MSCRVATTRTLDFFEFHIIFSFVYLTKNNLTTHSPMHLLTRLCACLNPSMRKGPKTKQGRSNDSQSCVNFESDFSYGIRQLSPCRIICRYIPYRTPITSICLIAPSGRSGAISTACNNLPTSQPVLFPTQLVLLTFVGPFYHIAAK